jgi:hypothetical protein
MNSRRFSLCIAALVTLIAMGAEAMAADPATQPAGGAASSDIELAKPPKYPTLITPTVEGGGLLDDHHGEPLLVQEFLFNPMTHELSLAKSSPVKQRMYGDSRIDAANYNSDLSFFEYLTTDRAPIGKIVLTVAKKKAVISYNYVISLATAKPTPIDPSTYCAFVQFVKGDECNTPGTTVMVRRNADQPIALADTMYSKISRKNDVITWTIERGGTVVKTGSFGFPVVATAPDLVKYVIQLP